MPVPSWGVCENPVHSKQWPKARRHGFSRKTWEKLGHVYQANGSQPWAQTHAIIPTPLVRDERTIRIYAAFLDRDKIGRVGYVEVDANEPCRVLAVSPRLVLDIGEPGIHSMTTA